MPIQARSHANIRARPPFVIPLVFMRPPSPGSSLPRSTQGRIGIRNASADFQPEAGFGITKIMPQAQFKGRRQAPASGQGNGLGAFQDHP